MGLGLVDASTLERWEGGEEDVEGEGEGEGEGGQGRELDFSDWDYLHNPDHK